MHAGGDRGGGGPEPPAPSASTRPAGSDGRDAVSKRGRSVAEPRQSECRSKADGMATDGSALAAAATRYPPSHFDTTCWPRKQTLTFAGISFLNNHGCISYHLLVNTSSWFDSFKCANKALAR